MKAMNKKQAKQIGGTVVVALLGLAALNTLANRFAPAARLRNVVNNGL